MNAIVVVAFGLLLYWKINVNFNHGCNKVVCLLCIFFCLSFSCSLLIWFLFFIYLFLCSALYFFFSRDCALVGSKSIHLHIFKLSHYRRHHHHHHAHMPQSLCHGNQNHSKINAHCYSTVAAGSTTNPARHESAQRKIDEQKTYIKKNAKL